MPEGSLVSIVIPTYNSSGFLEECLRSVKNQTYGNIETIVVDNFSRDNTLSIARRYADKVFTKGPERSAQRNFGVRKSEGRFVFFVDSDMKLSGGVVKSAVQKAESDGGVKGVIVPEESFGNGFWAKCKKLEKSFYVGIEWMEAARFFDKKAFRETGGYDEALIAGEDWDLSQKIGKKHKISRIREFIYHNEGDASLLKTIRKKFYYARRFANYVDKSSNASSTKGQTSIIERYKLFFLDPEKLFSDPFVGMGMLFMKTCEFGFGGIGYLAGKIGK